MTPDELRRELSADIDMLRAKGVQRYDDGKLKLEFFPPAAPEAVPETVAEPGRCLCGHMDYEHSGGLCAAKGGGCDPLKCSPEKK